MKRFFLQALAGIISIWSAAQIIPGVEFKGSIWLLILAGAILGVLSVFVKPLFNIIAFPIRILTLGLFGIIINMALVWIVDILFPEFVVSGLFPLLLTTLLFWFCSLFFSLFH